MSQWITLETSVGPVKAWHAKPEGTPRGGLVVIQEIFGVTQHIREVAEGYAAEGYEVIAPAFFDVVEKDVDLPYNQDGVTRGLELVGQLNFERPTEIVKAAAAQLASAGKVGTVGYCWGGTIALLSAIRLGLPSISYYGGRNADYLDQPVKAPVMFHFGEHDQHITPDIVQQHRDKLPQMEVFVYPADHGFNRTVGDSYEPASAKLALERSLAFLQAHLQ